MNVLFICRGNVGRSQMAETIFNSLATGSHHAVSAGTEVGEYEGEKLINRKSAEQVLEVLREIDIDAGNNVRNQLLPQMLIEADVIVSMAEPQSTPEFLAENKNVIYWDIIDPSDQSADFTRNTRDKITDRIQVLLRDL